MQPGSRVGVLWDYYRRLVEDGWEPDVYSYTTSFRWAPLMLALQICCLTSPHQLCLNL